jgi:hypothetical protein
MVMLLIVFGTAPFWFQVRFDRYGLLRLCTPG